MSGKGPIEDQLKALAKMDPGSSIASMVDKSEQEKAKEIENKAKRNQQKNSSKNKNKSRSPQKQNVRQKTRQINDRKANKTKVQLMRERGFGGLDVYSKGLNDLSLSKLAKNEGLTNRNPTAEETPTPLNIEAYLLSEIPVIEYPETIVRNIEYERSSDSHGKGTEDSDLTIGIDFGSTNTKVVIRSAERAEAIAIPFTEDKVNPYLLPSECHKLGNTYSLHPRPDSESLRNLKSHLIDNIENDEAAQNATAFLALTVRYAKRWFIENKSELWDCGDIEWRLNLGLPARDFQNKNQIRIFRMIGKVAFELASYRSQFISDADIIKLKKTTNAKIAELDYYVNVFPEISATLHGFVRSDRWDKSRTRVLLLDIGGETVDCTLANARIEKAKVNYSFLGCYVQRRGTMQLEQTRINWLFNFEMDDQIRGKLYDRRDRLCLAKQTPQSVTEYLRCDWNGEGKDIDKIFVQKVINEVYRNVLQPAKSSENQLTENFQNLQTFISGGGALVAHYRDFIPIINDNPNISINLELVDQVPPDNLSVDGSLDVSTYLRLAVAFGLSHDDIGQFVTPDKIKPLPKSYRDQDYRDYFVSNDMV